jgi:hypothetical protein
MLCIAAASFVLTSCLSDDDNENIEERVITNAEKAMQLASMEGFYNGNFYFDNDTTNAMDSISTSWIVNAADSSLSCPNFPVSSLANCVSNSTAKAVLKAAEDQKFEANLYPYWNENKDEGYYTFMMVPKQNTLSFSVPMEDRTYQVMLNLITSVNTYNGYGQQIVVYTSGAYMNSKMNVYLLIKDISIDYTLHSCKSIYLLMGKK